MCSNDMPYLDRALYRLKVSSQLKSKTPFIIVYRTPIRSFARPPLTSTCE